MKTILITGASTGIGRATALYFSARGWQVAATLRKPETADETLRLAPNVRLFALDVLDDASIVQAVEQVITAFGGVDVLVNNAGYGAVGAFEAASPQQIRRQFDTNVMGLMAVTQALLPHFRERKGGTIINISSMGGRITFPLYSLYHGTKWAVEGFSESLQFELRPFGIRVKLVEPGAIKTDFYSRSQDLITKPGLSAYDSYVTRSLAKMQAAGARAVGPEVVAAKIWQAANDASYRLRYPVGSGAPFLLFLRWLLPYRWWVAIVKGQVG